VRQQRQLEMQVRTAIEQREGVGLRA
jgi:hypothetical protein